MLAIQPSQSKTFDLRPLSRLLEIDMRKTTVPAIRGTAPVYSEGKLVRYEYVEGPYPSELSARFEAAVKKIAEGTISTDARRPNGFHVHGADSMYGHDAEDHSEKHRKTRQLGAFTLTAESSSQGFVRSVPSLDNSPSREHVDYHKRCWLSLERPVDNSDGARQLFAIGVSYDKPLPWWQQRDAGLVVTPPVELNPLARAFGLRDTPEDRELLAPYEHESRTGEELYAHGRNWEAVTLHPSFHVATVLMENLARMG